MRLLVVDDDIAHAAAEQRALRNEGYDVAVAHSTETALALVDGWRPRIVLLVELSDSDARLLMRKIRADRGIPLITVGALGDDPPGMDGVEEGPDDHVARPYSIAELVARIRTVLRNHARASRITAEEPDEIELQRLLDRAIDRGQIAVHYEPIVELATGAIVGFEALVRWETVQGVVTPDVFVGAAERTGQICEIGRIVMRTAAEQAHTWQKRFGHPYAMHVNVSPRQLTDPRFIRDVRDAVTYSGLRPGSFTVEITETLMMQDAEWTIARLDDLRALGVRVAIDDFGAGYSSLAYLHRFPVDSLKIDRSFVRSMGNGRRQWTLVRTIIELAETFKLRCVAEGIEDEETAKDVMSLGCEYGQGYFFGRPADAETMNKQLATRRALAG